MQTTEMTDQQAADALLMDEPEEQEAETVETEGVTDEEVEETEEAEEAETVEDEASQEAETPQERSIFTVKVDGKEQSVTLEELKRSYSGQAHIQRGMQQAAETRKQAEAEAQALRSERQQFLATLQAVQQQGIIEPPKAPDPAKINTDPIGYMREQAAYFAKEQEYRAQQQAIASQMQQHQAEQYRAHMARVAEEAQKLVQVIPDFGSREKAQKLYAGIANTAAEYGFTEQEISDIADARFVRVLYELHQSRNRQAVKEAAKAKPQPPRNVKPGANRSESPQLARERMLKEAARSGKIQDFAKLLRA